MKSIARKRRDARLSRHARVRKKISGTSERPRLCVYRSLKHIYAQIIDDSENRCLITVSSLSKDVTDQLGDAKGKTSLSTVVGKVIAEKAKAVGIEAVTFDRGGYLYHGRVKALAEGAREGGLKL
jgi:large subunit ribosomal protein L18